MFFNSITIADCNTGQLVNEFDFRYTDFDTLFLDWFYCCQCIKKEEFDFSKIHTADYDVSYAPKIELREDEKEATFIERDGKMLLVIRTNPQNGPISFVNHTSFRKD